MTLKRLSGIDTAFLAAERPGYPLHMMAVLILDPAEFPGGYSFEAFRDLMSERLDALGPLRRQLVEVPGSLAFPFWLEDAPIDIDLHLRRAAVPSPGGPRELSEMAAEMLERLLDRDRPLWEMVLVEGVEGGKVALLAKLHHAMMDGMAGVKLMASLFATSSELAPAPPRSKSTLARVPGGLELLARSVPWLMREPLRVANAAAQTARSSWNRSRSAAREPDAPELLVPRSWLNVPITAHRAVAYTHLPLARVKELAHGARATVNDVILTVVAGALRVYLAARDALPDEALVAGVPMAVRGDDDDRSNAVTSVAVGLATDTQDPAARLYAIRDAMASRKRARGSTVGDDLAAWAEVITSPFVFSLLTEAYIDLHLAERMDPICNLVVSSVPGPPTPLYLFGARLDGIYPLGPIYSGLALNVTAMSAHGSIDFGFVACRGRMPDLWDLVDGLPVALEELADALSTEPRSS
jgi:diacylglycerol O-acyltransferase